MKTLLLPLALSRTEALKLPELDDWPGMNDMEQESVNVELLWTPISRKTGTPLINNNTYPELELARVDFETMTVEPVEGEIVETENLILEPTKEEEFLYTPFYRISLPGQERGTVLINAASRSIVTGSLPVKPGPAKLHLLFFLGLALFSSFLAASLLYSLLAPIFMSQAKANSFIHSGITFVAGAAVTALFIARLRNLIPAWLREPTLRAANNRIKFPVDTTKAQLLRAAGYLAAVVALLFSLSLLGVSNFPNLLSVILSVTVLVLAVLFARHAFQLGGKIAQPGADAKNLLYNGKNNDSSQSVTEGPIPDLVGGIINVTLFSLAGALLAGFFTSSGLSAFFKIPQAANITIFMGHGAGIGAVIGLILAPMAQQSRIPLLAGMITQSIGEAFLGNWVGTALALVSVFAGVLASTVKKTSWNMDLQEISGYSNADRNSETNTNNQEKNNNINNDNEPGREKLKEKTGKSTKPINRSTYNLWNALKLSWSYAFGAAVGTLLGQMLAVFFLGPLGIKMGEIFGEKICALAAFQMQKAIIESQESNC